MTLNIIRYENVVPLIRTLAIETGVEKISEVVLGHPNFAVWSGSVQNKHHYGYAGLQHHTWEVIQLMKQQEAFFKSLGHTLDSRVLFLSGLYHDFGKIWDYFPINASYDHWDGTNHKRSIHHISRSAIEWSKAVERTGECKDIEDAVLHCILSHHGLREWGSPVFPWTKEAWILHHCDSLSARLNENGRIDLVHTV